MKYRDKKSGETVEIEILGRLPETGPVVFRLDKKIQSVDVKDFTSRYEPELAPVNPARIESATPQQSAAPMGLAHEILDKVDAISKGVLLDLGPRLEAIERRIIESVEEKLCRLVSVIDPPSTDRPPNSTPDSTRDA